MDRRGFVGTALAGAAGLFFPQKVKAVGGSEQWWEEEDFVFEGTPATRYLWPLDREIIFAANCTGKSVWQVWNNDVGHYYVSTGCAVWNNDEGYHLLAADCKIVDSRQRVRTFNVSLSTESLEKLVKTQIECCLKTMNNVHLHLIEVSGVPGEYGIMVAAKKLQVVTNMWKHRNQETCEE